MLRAICLASFAAAALAAGAATAVPSAIPPVAPAPSPAATAPAAGDAAPQPINQLSHNAQSALRDLSSISAEMRAGRVEDAAARLRVLLPSPDYAELPPAFGHIGYLMLANIDARAGRLDEAETAIRSATASPAATPADFQEQMRIGLARRDAREALQSLTTIAQRFPTALAGLNDNLVFAVYGAAAGAPDGQALRFQLVQALLAANWRPRDPFNDTSPMIVEQAVELIDHGDLAGARGLIGRVDEAGPMVGPRADNRFAPILATDPAAFDLAALNQRYLAKVDAAAAGAPGLLVGVRDKAAALIAAGRFDEALKLLDAALAKAQPADGSAPAYVDAEGELADTLAMRARALAGLGRYDEALTTMVRAANRPEAGHINLTQRLALARLQVSMGKASDALATLDVLAPSDLSPAGQVAVADIRVCAEAALGDHAAAQTALAAVRARGYLDPGAVVDASACAGDIDGAAATIVALLGDPVRRLQIITWAQTLKAPPQPPGPHPNADERRALLLARPDVQAALAKVGKIETAPLYRMNF
jgi:tetratricopeptide (TPR) repeat protein